MTTRFAALAAARVACSERGDGNAHFCLFRLLQGALKTGGLGIHDNWRIGLSRPFGQECDCFPASTLIDGTFRKLTCRKIMLRHINNQLIHSIKIIRPAVSKKSQ
jgi:hypothetical protein